MQLKGENRERTQIYSPYIRRLSKRVRTSECDTVFNFFRFFLSFFISVGEKEIHPNVRRGDGGLESGGEVKYLG